MPAAPRLWTALAVHSRVFGLLFAIARARSVDVVNASSPLDTQEGVLSSRQACGLFGRAVVRAHLAARRWQRPVRGVVVLHNGPLTEAQNAWVALLGCPPGSALGGFTALDFDRLQGFTAEEPTVVIPHGADKPERLGARIYCSTMLGDEDVHPLRTPRRTRPQRSLVDEASWTPNERYARAIVLAGVQQRLAPTRHLRDALTRRGPCRHRALIVESILDAAGGVQSLPERDFGTIWRTRGLPPPTTQAVRRRPDGKYYLDAAWLKYDAAAEVHGIPHMRVLQWDSDLFRANEVVVSGPRLLIFSSYAVRREQPVVGDQLVALLRRGGWRG